MQANAEQQEALNKRIKALESQNEHLTENLQAISEQGRFFIIRESKAPSSRST